MHGVGAERRQMHFDIPVPHIDGLVQDCKKSIANALELLQSCTEPSICSWLVGVPWEDLPCRSGQKWFGAQGFKSYVGVRFIPWELDFAPSLFSFHDWHVWRHFDWLVQERRNSSALTMELRLSCTNPSIWWFVSEPIKLTPYMVLPLFATRFADYAGVFRVSFIQPPLF